MASEVERKELRERCERDIWFLLRKVLGFGFLTEEFQREYAEFAQDGLHPWKHSDPTDKQWRLLLAPRGFGKTTCFTTGGCIQASLRSGIGKDGNWRSPHFSQGIAHAQDEQAQAMLGEVRAQWESNEMLKWIAPDLAYKNPRRESNRWQAGDFMLKRPTYYRVGSVVAFSPEASAVGKHFDIAWIDDGVMDTNSQTGETRKKITDWYKTIENLLKKTGWRRYMVTGTHWDIDDAYMAMRDPGGDFAGNVKVKVYQARMEDGRALWPDKFPLDVLEKSERLNPYLFSCTMQNDPMPAGIASFESEFVQRYTVEYRDDGNDRWVRPFDDRNYRLFTAVDPNTSEDSAYDPAVVTTMAWDSAGCLWMVDMSRGHPSPSELIAWIREHVQRYNPSEILYEDVQAQKVAFHWMDKDSLLSGVRYPITPVKRGPRNKKYDRIMLMAPLIRSKGLFIPNGPKFSPVMDEIKKYSKRAKRDDILDTMADVFAHGRSPSATMPTVQAPSDPYLLRRLVAGRPSEGGAQESCLGALENIYYG